MKEEITKPTYKELEIENNHLKSEKIERQKASMHTVREICMILTHLCGINKLPATVDLNIDYNKEDFYDYIPNSMIRTSF